MENDFSWRGCGWFSEEGLETQFWVGFSLFQEFSSFLIKNSLSNDRIYWILHSIRCCWFSAENGSLQLFSTHRLSTHSHRRKLEFVYYSLFYPYSFTFSSSPGSVIWWKSSKKLQQILWKSLFRVLKKSAFSQTWVFLIFQVFLRGSRFRFSFRMDLSVGWLRGTTNQNSWV